MLKPISIEDFSPKFYNLWDSQWLVLSAGDFSTGKYNAMTVSWGGLGSLWEKPFAQVFVRNTRHTFQFMNDFDTFTLCSLPKDKRKSLSILGAQSGRDGDKIAAAGLTPAAALCVSAPIYAEAELVIECKKMYWADFDPDHFLDAEIGEHYPLKDYHRCYYGEILAIRANED